MAIPPAPGTAAKVLSQEDVASILAGVSFSKSASVVDGVNAIRISDGESRVIVYSVTDNSGSATATSLNASLDLALQKAPFASIVDVQTLKFNGDPKSASVSVDLSSFRVLANGAPVGISGGNLFSVKNVDASAAIGTSVQLVGSSVANNLVGSVLSDTLTGGGGNDTLLGGAGDDRFILGATDLSALASLAGQDGQDTLVRVRQRQRLSLAR